MSPLKCLFDMTRKHVERLNDIAIGQGHETTWCARCMLDAALSAVSFECRFAVSSSACRARTALSLADSLLPSASMACVVCPASCRAAANSDARCSANASALTVRASVRKKGGREARQMMDTDDDKQRRGQFKAYVKPKATRYFTLDETSDAVSACNTTHTNDKKSTL